MSEEKERSFPGEGPLAQESLIGKWMGWGGRRAEEQESKEAGGEKGGEVLPQDTAWRALESKVRTCLEGARKPAQP